MHGGACIPQVDDVASMTHRSLLAERPASSDVISPLAALFSAPLSDRHPRAPHAPPALMPEPQGLTLVHFSAQRKRFLRDRGCVQGLFRGCLGGVREWEGVYRVCTCVRNGSS